MRIPEPDDRGAGTILTAAIMLVLALVTALAVVVTGWLDCLHRSRSDADLAALAAAGAHVRGLDACAAARRSASANGGEVVRCSLQGDAVSFTVSVRVAVALVPRLRGGPRVVGSDAVAGSGMR